MRTEYSAVVVPTGPSLRIDQKRAEDAINAISRHYGSLQRYNGLWVVAGTLGEQRYETSQRKKILDRLLEERINEKSVRIIGGEDTMDKVREMIALSKEEGLNNFGISTYWLHYKRFNQGLSFAKQEGIAPKDLEFSLIWSPTTPKKRWAMDIVYGVAGLFVEAVRLNNRGFSGATPSYKPLEKMVSGPIKEWASDKTGIEEK